MCGLVYECEDQGRDGAGQGRHTGQGWCRCKGVWITGCVWGGDWVGVKAKAKVVLGRGDILDKMGVGRWCGVRGRMDGLVIGGVSGQMFG